MFQWGAEEAAVCGQSPAEELQRAAGRGACGLGGARDGEPGAAGHPDRVLWLHRADPGAEPTLRDALA